MLRKKGSFSFKGLCVVPVLAALALAPSGPVTADDRTGVSQADLPVVRGQFTIFNNTSSPITYLVRWGDQGFWDKVVLQPGWIETHRRVLDGNLRTSTPHVQFHHWVDGRVQTTTYDMDFYAVYYSPAGTSGASKPYYFGLSDAQVLDLFSYE